MLAGTFFLLVNVVNAQVIVVQHGTDASVFTSLDAAMQAASPGDYLYLSGDHFVVHGISAPGSDSLDFYKPLHFIGAGIDANSTSVTGQTSIQGAITPTNLSGTLAIGNGAGGSTFDGIYFAVPGVFFQNDVGTPDNPGHFSFSRCIMNQVNFVARGGGPWPGAVSAEFHECIITQGLGNAGSGSSSATIDRCIVMAYAQSLSASVSWTNCILGAPGGAGSFTNCIIYGGSNSFVNQFGAVYTNCLLGEALPTSGSDVFANCIGDVDMSTVFVNAPVKGFAWSNDYHLVNNSPAITYGNDGYDCGIYGSATATKAGYVPYNPHYTSVIIPASTDASGNLNINIHVSAQPY
jgi:hypothetical protein